MSGNRRVILIRCDAELQVRFRRAAADFRSYSELVAKLLDVYESNPELFGSKPRGMRYA